MTYRAWPEGLPRAVEVGALRPPGVFGGQLGQPFTSLMPMVEETAALAVERRGWRLNRYDWPGDTSPFSALI
jgi:hypothetical protein